MVNTSTGRDEYVCAEVSLKGGEVPGSIPGLGNLFSLFEET